MEPIQREGIATVWTTSSGAPERFVWHERHFVICAYPISWMARVRWWQQSTEVLGTNKGWTVERPMWQVQAKGLDDGEMLIFDLAVAEGPQWSIRVVSE